MIRLIVMMLAGALALLPASAQTLQRSDAGAMALSVSDVQFSATSFAAERADRFEQVSATADRGASNRGGAFASAVFRVLASQNSIDLNGMPATEMDAVLRPPEAGAQSGTPSLFRDAKRLYDSATSIRTERAVLYVDPLSLKCRLRVSLGSR